MPDASIPHPAVRAALDAAAISYEPLECREEEWAGTAARMRCILGSALLLLAACASSGTGIDSRVIEGGPGQEIEVSINAVDNSVITPDADGSRQYTVEVEVSNSENYPITVTQISIRTTGNGAFQVYPTSRKMNEMIDPLKDHLFEITLRGRKVRNFAPDEARNVTLSVMVTLATGETYAYEFEGPVKDDSSVGRP